MKSFWIALSFLTVLPVPYISFSREENEFSASAGWFPVAGALLGLIISALFLGLIQIIPVETAVVLVLAAGFFLTRGLHLDGLADVADGLVGTTDPEKTRAAMKDSSVGVMGLAAVVLLFLLKYSVLISLQQQFLSLYLFLAPVVGRWLIVLPGSLFAPARREGLGDLFLEDLRWPELLKASAWLLIIAVSVIYWQPLLLEPFIWGAAAALAAGLGLSIWAARRLGGLTGDVLGAVSELSEAMFLLGVVAATTV